MMEIYAHRAVPEHNGHRPADPGDFGVGPYWTTSIHRARAYGRKLTQKVLVFQNPLCLGVEEAYDIGEIFGTIHGTSNGGLYPRMKASEEMTRVILALGFDGIVVTHRDGELECVDIMETIKEK